MLTVCDLPIVHTHTHTLSLSLSLSQMALKFLQLAAEEGVAAAYALIGKVVLTRGLLYPKDKEINQCTSYFT